MILQIQEVNTAADMVPDMISAEANQQPAAILSKILSFWPLIRAALYLAKWFTGRKAKQKITSLIIYIDTISYMNNARIHD